MFKAKPSFIAFAAAAVLSVAGLAYAAPDLNGGTAKKTSGSPQVLAQASPSEPEATSSTFQDWVVNCRQQEGAAPADAKKKDAAKRCEMVQNFVSKANGQVVARVALGRGVSRKSDPEGDKEIKLVIQLPVGVWLPEGVAIASPDKKINLKAGYTFCSGAACFAELGTKKDFLDFAKGGGALTMTFMDGAQQAATMSISTKGFGPAFAAIEK